jgi:hypothetical protein
MSPGLFDTAGIDRALPELVPAADWLQVRILLDGAPIVHHPGDWSSRRMTLDMRRGALLSHGDHSNSPDIIARVRSLRVVSLRERAVRLGGPGSAAKQLSISTHQLSWRECPACSNRRYSGCCTTIRGPAACGDRNGVLL